MAREGREGGGRGREEKEGGEGGGRGKGEEGADSSRDRTFCSHVKVNLIFFLIWSNVQNCVDVMCSVIKYHITRKSRKGILLASNGFVI